MTWRDLYNTLHQKANNINDLGHFDWLAPVRIYNLETGDEYNCEKLKMKENPEGKNTPLLSYKEVTIVELINEEEKD
jgi:hypothetical protein